MNKSNSPFFSIILAFRNEFEFLKESLDSFDKQTLPRENWEIILVDGCSDDNSTDIAKRYVEANANSILVNNPQKNVTAGWNQGLKVALGKYFCLASGHSITDENFLTNAIEILQENNEIHALGGKAIKIGLNTKSKSIAAATNTPLAMGGSYYRIGDSPKRVNVIGAGIYLRNIIDVIGVFDDNLKRSGDWEFNYRVCKSGFNMYFNPGLKIKFFSRANYRSIFNQQFRTGFWKVRVWAKHPRSLLLRHIVPVFFVVWLLAIPLSILVNNMFSLIWLLPLLPYLFLIVISNLNAKKENIRMYYVVLTFPVIHIAYGLGFIAGIFRWAKHFFEPSGERS